MTSFLIRTLRENSGPHVRVEIFAGADEGHRAYTGAVTMYPDEAAEFERLVIADALVREAERSAEVCPGCGCDWDTSMDPHDEECPYVRWGGQRGYRATAKSG